MTQVPAVVRRIFPIKANFFWSWRFVDILRRRPAGFTLLDSLMVIVILGIVGMAIIPQFQGMVQETRLNEAAAELVSGMQYAGSLAVRYRRPFGFQADAAGHWFKIYDNRYAADADAHTADDPPVTALGVVLNPLDKSWYVHDFDDMENYRAVTFTSAQIAFYPDGHSAASNTTVTVSLGGIQRTITVDGATGRISVQ
ncbi:MAG TPA: GspH/FimT family pseudopilin [Syntrophales bacterium]|nr:GspH/FimT family pseudopilin [Syntrophales bacterium]